MKNHPYLILLFLAAVLGCNVFSGSENSGITNLDRDSQTANANDDRPSAQPTTKEFAQHDYVGRWGVKRDFKDHIIELREDGTGTIILDESGKTEAKQDFTWEFQAKNAVFTVKAPIVDRKMVESGSLIIHAKLIDDGTKLQTDFSPYTRTRGDDTWEQK